MKNLLDFTGKKILVTGASSGIGQAAAVLLSQLGAGVVLVARSEEKLHATWKMMENGALHQIIPFDVRNFREYDGLFEKATEDGVKLSGLVHSAGIAKATPLKILKKESIDEIFEVNVTSFLCLAAKYAKRKFSDGGSIVGISAVNAHYPQKCMGVYAASKGALEASVSTMAVELSKQNIRINSVIAGAVRTPMTDSLDAETVRSIEAKQLYGALKAEQVANTIAFLLSDASSGITGRNIYTDGGYFG